MSSTDKLDSLDRILLVRIKIERAKKHLQDLKAVATSLADTTILTPDPDTHIPPHPIVLMHPHNFQTVPTLPIDAVTIAGDVVHNLRSALDHLARQLVLVGMDIAPPAAAFTDKDWRKIYFPIAETAEMYEAEKPRKIKGMLMEAVEAIDRLKPYKGGNDPLWRIHELDNIDKHRSFFTLGHDFLFTADWYSGTYLMKVERPNFSGVESQVEQDIQLEIEKSSSQPQITEANPLIPSLQQLVDFAEDLILSFRPLLRNTYERVG